VVAVAAETLGDGDDGRERHGGRHGEGLARDADGGEGTAQHQRVCEGGRTRENRKKKS